MSTPSGAVGSDDSSAAKKLIISHSPWQLMWLGLCCVALVVALAPETPTASKSSADCVLYAAQGLIVEWLGMRVTPDAVVIPRRFANAPCFTLWRKRVIAGPDIGHHLHVEIARTGARRAARFARRENFDAVPEPRDKTGVFFGGQGVRAQNQHLQR